MEKVLNMKTLIRNLFILVLNFLYNNKLTIIMLILGAIFTISIYLFYSNILMFEFVESVGLSLVSLLLLTALISVIILLDITVPIIKFIETSLKGIKIDKSWKNK